MMKISFMATCRFTVTVLAVTGFWLFNSTVQAQTFTGKRALTESPSSLRTILIPALNSSVIRVMYEKEEPGAVRILVRNQRGDVVYEACHYKPKYAGQLDLSSMPAGLYRLELRTPNARSTNYFRIEWLANQSSTTIHPEPVPLSDDYFVAYP